MYRTFLIAIHRTHSGTITNNDGYFTLEMLNIDNLEVTSVGYRKTIMNRITRLRNIML